MPLTLKTICLNTLALCAACALGSLVHPVSAQTAGDLPKDVSGRWTYVVPATGNTMSLPFSMQFATDGEKVSGRMTWYGNNCGAKDEPLTGTFANGELKIVSAIKANVSTQRPHGSCEPNEFHLRAKLAADGKTFDGKAWRLSAEAATVDVKFGP